MWEAVPGAVLALLQTNVRAVGPKSKVSSASPAGELLGELTAIVALPYLGPAAARRERARHAPSLARDRYRGGQGSLGLQEPAPVCPSR